MKHLVRGLVVAVLMVAAAAASYTGTGPLTVLDSTGANFASIVTAIGTYAISGFATAANQVLTMGVIGAATAPADMQAVGAVYNTTVPSLSGGQSAAMQSDSHGNLHVQSPVVTPAAGTAHAIVTGGTAVTMVTGPVNGCQIVNPASTTDEAISATENAYVNPVTTAGTTGNGTNTALQPGQQWNCPGALPSGVSVSVNAATAAHALTVLVW
jgi:hypothetical protein